jgi:DHA1 family inner membrane transport protein
MSRTSDRPPASDQAARRAAVLMFAILLASYAMNAMDRQVFPLLLPDVRKEYGFAIADAGLLSTIFTAGMAIAGIPTGFLLARYSRKTILQLGVAIFSVGTAVTVLSQGFGDMLIYRATTGIGEAMQITVLIAISANYFVRYRSAAVGTLSFTYGIGAIIGPILAGNLLAHFHNWRVPMLAYGALGLVAMLFIAIFVRHWFSETVAAPSDASVTVAEDRLWNHNIVVLTGISVLWGLTLQSYFGLYPTFLREGLHFSPTDAATIMSFFGVGGLSSIGGGWLGDRLSIKTLMVPAFAAAAVLGYLPFHGVTDFGALAVISLLYGAIAGGILFVNVAGYHVKAVSPRLASRAAGLFVTTFYAAGAIAGYILGFLVHHYGWAVASEIQQVGLPLLACVSTLAIRSNQMSVRIRPGALNASVDGPLVAR